MTTQVLWRTLPFFLIALATACGGGGYNQPPVVSVTADPFGVNAGETVTLSGMARDADGNIASMAWEQTDGALLVSLHGADGATATFTAPAAAGTLTFRLTVTDNEGAEASAEVTVRVEWFASASAGGDHTCWVRATGAVACWGDNSEGQSTTPGSLFASVSAGGLHTCGVRESGAVACWPEPPGDQYCEFMPAAETRGPVPGLIVAADVLLPEGHEPDYGVHVRFNGSIGAVADFDTLQAAHSAAAVLDCRGKAVLSPGFVNAHEHPAYSYAFPDENLNPDYVHRDEWRLGLNGKVPLPSPTPYWFEPDDAETAAILIAMELRHLLGGATTIAGSGGVPGVIRNINRHRRDGDLALYDAEAHLSTFPFSFRVVEDLRDECAGGPAYQFPFSDNGNWLFMAYVPHVGEGRYASCAARAEVARYLQHVQQRDRRYSLVHGVATDWDDYALMREFDVTLVWSPRSNLALYGETVDLAGVLESGVRVALSTDWSPSGSFNMREEIKCAKRVAQDAGVVLSHEELWHMSTGSGAYALGLEDQFGAIMPGLWADLILVKYTGGNPYDAVLTATDEDVLATWIDGQAVLLAEALNEALGKQDCVTLDNMAPQVCGVLDAFGLSPESFDRYIEAVVPVNDVSRQAPCENVP